MPFGIAADPDRRFVIFRATDPYSIQEWRSANLELFQDDAYRATRALLVDRREASPPETVFVGEMLAFLAEHPGDLPHRVAIVVRDDAAAFGMARMTELKSEATPVSIITRVFRVYDQAGRWLSGRG